MTKHSSAWVPAILVALGALGTGPVPTQALAWDQGQQQSREVVGVTGLGPLGQAIARLPLAVEPLWAQIVPQASAPGAAPSSPTPIGPPPNAVPRPLLPRSAPASLDPAEQVEPTVLDLGSHNRPISPVLAMAMRQELNNLIGRFESALLMADSAGLPTEVSLAAQPNVALAAAVSGAAPESSGPPLHPALVEARRLQTEWSDLVERGDHAIARQRWQAARQGLWDNFPTDRPAAQAEIRAIWLDRGTLVQARNPAGLAQVFDRLAAAGVNTVFIETVNAGYPIYPSRVAPYRNPLVRGWDPLKEAIDLAHARGMTAHAWVWTFAAGNQVHNTLLRLPLDYPGPLLSLYPDWAGYDNQGNIVPPGQTKPFLDPANQEVRSYLLRLISEIITQYDVDGLQLDYIRYPFQDPGAGRSYGYGTAARWRFRTMTGIDPLQLATWPGPSAPEADRRWHRQMWDRWTEFRVQQVTSFVQEVSFLAKRQRPDLILSTAVFARPETERLQKIQQDWGTWAREGYVDWVVLMSYAEDTNRFEQIVKPWLTDPSLSQTLIIPGIRLLNLPQPAALDQVLAVRDLPTPGYALFAAADLNASLQTVFSRTQGQVPSALPNDPQQAAFAMAHSRYQSLQREWNLLLGQRQLWMEQPVLTAWVEEVNRLEKDLQTLSEQPSARRLQEARTRLERVRGALNDSVLVQATNSSYRLQTWRYRLTTIERLLAYGEQPR